MKRACNSGSRLGVCIACRMGNAQDGGRRGPEHEGRNGDAER